MFWWYNMYSSADWSATPRPMYPADGRKIPDHYAYPPELHDELDARLGQFPLFKFWGPLADITSTDWIAEATLHVMATRQPTLTLAYLPHLDYNLQRLGPDLANPRLQKDLRGDRRALRRADRGGGARGAAGDRGLGVRDHAGDRRDPHQPRAAGGGPAGGAAEEHGRETLDAGASAAFAVADHQVAHVYVRDPARVAEVTGAASPGSTGWRASRRGRQARERARPSALGRAGR